MIDNSPDMNRSECDSVLVSLTSEEPAVPSRQTLSGIYGAHRYVTLYTEGAAFSLVTVDDRWTTVLTEGRHRHRARLDGWSGQYCDVVEHGSRGLGDVLRRNTIQSVEPFGRVPLRLGGHVGTILSGNERNLLAEAARHE